MGIKGSFRAVGWWFGVDSLAIESNELCVCAGVGDGLWSSGGADRRDGENQGCVAFGQSARACRKAGERSE